MKLYKKVFIPFLSAMLVFTACEDFEELNTDPNAPVEVPTSALLTSAQKELVDNIWDEWFNGRFGMLYAQYWSQTEYTDESRYLIREGTNNTYWGNFYTSLNNLEEIIRLNEVEPIPESNNQIAVATILQVWQFQVMTDVYGPIPYTEALMGAENVSPSYDSQEVVYAGLLAQLNEAIGLIDVNEGSFASGDIIYGGDMTNWLKFANSLKMRVAIRIADVQPQVSAQAINDAMGGAFTSIDDAALFTYLGTRPNNNPINDAYLTRQDFAVNETLVDYLQENEDPRLPFYAAPNQDGEFVGMPYGLTQAQAGAISNAEISLPSELVRGATAPAIYMEYSEVLFILAEAAARDFISGDPATYYNQAIEASIDFWAALAGESIDNRVVRALIAEVPYTATGWGAMAENQIGRQKWVALYMQGLQGWIEWRRLDFDGLVEEPAAGSLIDEVSIPVRYTYPNEEQSLNAANYAEAVGSLDEGDTQASRVWWDVE